MPGWSTASSSRSACPTSFFVNAVSQLKIFFGVKRSLFRTRSSMQGSERPNSSVPGARKLASSALFCSSWPVSGSSRSGSRARSAGKPSFRTASGSVGNASVIIHGLAYDFSNFKHPAAGQTFNGSTNPLIQGGWGVAGNDISFMFQNVGQRCKGMFSDANNSTIPSANGDLEWYFPCKRF